MYRIHTQNTQYRMHYVILASTRRWILFIKYNISYSASVLLNFKYIHTHTYIYIHKIFLKTIIKRQNIPPKITTNIYTSKRYFISALKMKCS